MARSMPTIIKIALVSCIAIASVPISVRTSGAQPRASEPCPVLQLPRPDDPAHFLTVVFLLFPITQTAYALETNALNKFQTIRTIQSDSDFAVAIADVHFYLSDASDAYRCSLQLLQPYVVSNEKTIQAIASRLRETIQLAAGGQADVRATLSNLIEGRPFNAGDLVRDMTSFGRERNTLREAVQVSFRRGVLAGLGVGGFASVVGEGANADRVKAQLVEAFGDQITSSVELSRLTAPATAREVAALIYAVLSSAPRTEACDTRAERVFFRNYLNEAIFRDTYAGGIQTLVNRYGLGNLTDSIFIRTIDGPAFLNAEVRELDCAGMRRFLMVLGKRLLFFAWRTSLLLSRYGADIEWPPNDVLENYAEAIKTYFGFAELTDANLSGLQEVVAGTDVLSAYRGFLRGDLAELFVVLHEVAHIRDMDDAPEHRQSVLLPADLPETADREGWQKELQADADSLVGLWLRSKDISTSCLAANTLLNALAVLEDITEKAPVSAFRQDGSRRTHPPASLRRTNLTRVCQSLGTELGMVEREIVELEKNSRQTGMHCPR